MQMFTSWLDVSILFSSQRQQKINMEQYPHQSLVNEINFWIYIIQLYIRLSKKRVERVT